MDRYKEDKEFKAVGLSIGCRSTGVMSARGSAHRVSADISERCDGLNERRSIEPSRSGPLPARQVRIDRGSGAGLVNLDATIARTFHPMEKVATQFRAEFFNVANHPNFNLIGRVVNDPTFGIVQNQLPPRQIQFALKVRF